MNLGVLRDLSVWDEILQDQFLVEKINPNRDDFGNVAYFTPNQYVGRISFLDLQRGTPSIVQGEVAPLVEPNFTLFCNLFDIDPDDRLTLLNIGNQKATAMTVEVFNDQYGPHHLEITARFIRV